MKIIENIDGLFYWEAVDGESVTSSVPFTRDQTKTRTVDDVEETYNVYDDLISQGYKLVPLPQATKDKHEQEQATERANQEALSYLASTDWYVLRQMDSGKVMPEDVKQLREEARARIA